MVGWLDANGLSGSTAAVWSSDAWVYALADLQIVLPTPPIYNDEVLLGFRGPVEEVGGERAAGGHRDVSRLTASSIPRSRNCSTACSTSRSSRAIPDTVWVRSDKAAHLP